MELHMRRGRLINMAAARVERRRRTVEAKRFLLCIRKLRWFAQTFWKIASPQTQTLVWGPHLDILCDEMQAVFEESDRRRAIAAEILSRHKDVDQAGQEIEEQLGQLPPLRLVINVPPRSGKSTLVQKLALAWRWLHRPGEQILALASNDTLIERDGAALRRVVQSKEYRALLAQKWALDKQKGEPWTLRPDQNAKRRFENTDGGSRSGYPFNAAFTGVDADGIYIDDPNDVKEILNSTPERVAERMKETSDTYADKILDRLNSQIYGYVILIMQRLDERDLAQYMIDEGAAVVCLPTEYDPAHPNVYTSGTQWHPAAKKEPARRYNYKQDGDWRIEPEQLLIPALLPRSRVAALKKRPQGWLAKHQQRPLQLSRGKIKRTWFKRYHADPYQLAREADEVWGTSDTAQKNGSNNDLHSIQIWARHGAKYFLLDRVAGRMTYPEYEAAMDAIRLKWRAFLDGFLIEDTANGATYLQMKGHEGGLHDFMPNRDTPGKDTSKKARAKYFERAAAAGQVHIPAVDHEHTHLALQVEEWLLYICAFPAEPDDDMDASSQLIMRFELEAREAESGGTASLADDLFGDTSLGDFF